MKGLTVLSERFQGKGQTCDYIGHFSYKFPAQFDAHMLRVRIHCDSHKAQAWASVERWGGTQWREVASTRGDALVMDTGIGYARERIGEAVFTAEFRPDRDALLALAIEVLG